MQDFPRAWRDRERELADLLHSTRSKVDLAYRDNFDCPTALQAIMDLISASYIYLHASVQTCPQVVGAG